MTIKDLREASGMTMKDFAELFGRWRQNCHNQAGIMPAFFIAKISKKVLTNARNACIM